MSEVKLNLTPSNNNGTIILLSTLFDLIACSWAGELKWIQEAKSRRVDRNLIVVMVVCMRVETEKAFEE